MNAVLGILLALMVFLYPLGMPLVTIGVAVFASRRAGENWRQFAARSLWAIGVLAAVCSPGIVRNGAGTFALPWWLHLLVGHTGVEYYVLEYLLVCLALVGTLSGVRWLWRTLLNPSKT
jgi:hypothetical protein